MLRFAVMLVMSTVLFAHGAVPHDHLVEGIHHEQTQYEVPLFHAFSHLSHFVKVDETKVSYSTEQVTQLINYCCALFAAIFSMDSKESFYGFSIGASTLQSPHFLAAMSRRGPPCL